MIHLSDVGFALIIVLMWLSGFMCGWTAGRGPKEWRRVFAGFAQWKRHLRHRSHALGRTEDPADA